MITIAWQTVRARTGSFVGSFVTLAFGVALLTASALSALSALGTGDGRAAWLARADVVVAGAASATLTADDAGEPHGVGTGPPGVADTVESRALPADLPRRLSTVDGDLVVDHAGYATVTGETGDRIHPWSIAALHRSTWAADGPPAGPDSIVLTSPAAHRVGDRITAQTAAGPRDFVVSGVLDTTAPAAFYTTDAVAAELAGDRIAAIALTAHPGTTAAALAAQVRAAAGGDVRVLSGADRVEAAPDPDYQLRAAALIVLGNSAGIGLVVAAFIVASTFAYAVATRRREFGLLRSAGATPRQVRRLVLGEAMTVAVVACLAGAALGYAVAAPFARWLGTVGLAPPGYTARFIWWAVAAAIGVGMLVALVAAWLSARRAGRIRPIEALREAAVDQRAMTAGRWIAGLLAVGGAVPLAVAFSTSDTATLTGYFFLVVLLLITGCAILSPVLLRPLVWLLTAPAGGVTGTLVRHSTLTAMRRTAATVAPIVVTIGLAAGALAGESTIIETGRAAAEHRIVAPALVTGPVSERTVAAVARAPGIRAGVAVTDRPVYVYGPNPPYDWTGRYVDGPALSRVVHLPVVAGSLDDLTGTDTVAVPAGRWRLGDTLRIALADSTAVSLRVVAIVDDQIDLARMLLLPAALLTGHTGAPLADLVYLDLEPGADTGPAAAAATAGGGTLVPTAQFHAVLDDEGDRLNTLATVALLGMALLYTAIGIANTLLMATSGRARDVAVLRLSGATPGQVLRMICAEAVLVTALGAVLAVVAVVPAVAGLVLALRGRNPEVLIVVPWWPVTAIAGTCLVIALAASLVPAGVLVRRRPADLAGTWE
ncbi:ABC transporter permease [Dactylosporangium sp. NPDC049525]|uniref:ABC transporter permease n=1 Tax=Dactylosporangium sp. NPDC049525 TaxID=3154730 RepID=UPI00343F14E9